MLARDKHYLITETVNYSGKKLHDTAPWWQKMAADFPQLKTFFISNSSNSGGETFESRFASRFKNPQFLPPPEPFTQCQKTYPSKTQPQRQGQRMLNDGSRIITVVDRSGRNSIPKY